MGKLLAGAAKCDITPTGEMFDLVNGDEGNRYDGIHEHTYFRVIAVSDGTDMAILGGYDLIIAPFCDKMNETLREKYGIRPENCVFACTHNHEAFELRLREGNDYHEEPIRPASEGLIVYSEWVFEKVLQTIDKAIKSMKPAKVGYKIGSSYINACRDMPTPFGPMQCNNFHGPSNHQLTVIRFDDLEGNTIGLFTNHGTHSNSMVWNVMNGTYRMYNNDLGGHISRFVENATKNQFPVIWAIGPAGDQNPIVRSVWRIIDVDSDGNFSIAQHVFHPETNILQLKGIASTQGMEILELYNSIRDFTDEVCFKGADVKYEVLERYSYVELGLFSEKPGRDPRENIQCGDRPEPKPTGDNVQLRFRLFRLTEDIAFASFDGEPYAELDFLTREIVPAKALVYCEASFGMMAYIPGRESQWTNGFGTCNSRVWSGDVASETFEKAFKKLTREVYGQD